MPHLKPLVRRAGLDALYFSGANRLFRPVAEGVGAILMFHRVKPVCSGPFQPNKFLEVSPRFLEQTIKRLKRNGYKFVSLDDARARLIERRFDERFVVLTFDDGFRDNKIWAQPILAKHRVPYAVFIPTGCADGVGNLWWLTLESIVAHHDAIEIDDFAISCGTPRDKARAFAALRDMVMSQPTPCDERAFVCRLAQRYRHDQAATTRSVCMNWDEVSELAKDPLATVGAHTVSHPVLAKAEESLVWAELKRGRDILEDKLQRDVHHLAYPYGSADAVGPREFTIASQIGYHTAVTTRPGVLMPGDADCLMQLPRITIDGSYQREHHLDVLVSGVAPSAWNGIRQMLRLDAIRSAWGLA